MAATANTLDRILQAAPDRNLPDPARTLLIQCSSPAGFKVAADNAVAPASITFDAVPVSMPGAVVTWSITGGTLTTAGNRATLTAANATADSIVITASLTYDGQSFAPSITVGKTYDGAKGEPGSPGTSPNKNAVAFLYKWSSTVPAKPAGTSTFTWAGAANTAYSGGDGWSISAPANPGTPLLQLFVAQVAVTAAATAVTSTVGYSSSSVSAWAANGANGTKGDPGQAGMQQAFALVYQWAASIPAGPTGSASFVWGDGSFGAAPANWSLTSGNSPSPGMTLWQARVTVLDVATAASTAFSWTSASITAIGYAGTDGNGTPGAQGASYVTAYCASTTATATSAPAQTTGKNSVPAANSGGITGTWSKTVPTLTVGQFMYQTDGIYDPATDKVTWSIPYWSSLKVGTLSAITANLGAITGGSIDIGSGANSWHVNAQGDMWIGADTFASAPFRVSKTGVLYAQTGIFRGAVMGGSYTSWSSPPPGGRGFYLGPEGLVVGNYSDGKYIALYENGNLASPEFSVVDGAATFAGSLTAAKGTLGTLRIAAGGYICTGGYNGWNGPAPGTGGGFVLEARGAVWGNYADGRFVAIYENGDILAPGFSLANKQLTLDKPIIINPNIRTEFSANMTNLTLNNQVNTSTYASYSKAPVLSNGVGNYKHRYSLEVEEGDMILGSDPTADTAIIKARGTNRVCSGYLVDEVYDASGARAVASCRVYIQFGTGVPT